MLIIVPASLKYVWVGFWTLDYFDRTTTCILLEIALMKTDSDEDYVQAAEVERWIPELPPGEVSVARSRSDVDGIGNASISIVSYGLLSQKSAVMQKIDDQNFQVGLL